MAEPTVVAADEVEYPTGGESRYFELTLPGGTLPGDVFVFNVTTNVDSVTAITAPTEAVQLMAMGGGAGIGVSGGLWWYEVPAVVPVKAIFDWGLGITRRGTLAWVQFRGDDLQAHVQDMGAWGASSVTSHAVPPVVTTEADCVLLAGVMIGSGSDTPTIPSPWVVRTDATQREGRTATRSFPTAGTTPAVAFTTTGGYRSRPWQLAISSGGTPAPVIFDVMADAQTAYIPALTGDIADTPAIWVDEDNRSRSVILGSRKAVTGGGIDVYDLSGARLSFWGAGEVNNVSVRDFKGKAGWGDRILVVGTNRTNNTLTYGWLDRAARTLSAAGSTAVGFEPYGCCLYVSPVDGSVYAFVSEATGGAGGLKQYRLTLSGSTVTGTQVRSMPTATLAEGMVCDDASQTFFLTEEAAGFFKYGAEPGAGTSRTTIDLVGGTGGLVADVEGVSIAYGRGADPSYLVVSSQGNDSFVVYDLAAPHAYVKSFRVVGNEGLIGDTTQTDGLAITRADLSPWWPDGLLVVHDTDNAAEGQPASNFKLVDAGRIFPELSYRAPATLVTGTDTSTLTAPVDRWVKSPMTPVWYDATADKWRALLPAGSSGHRFYDLALGSSTQGAVVDNRAGTRCTAVHHAGTTYVVRARTSPTLFSKYNSSLTQIGSDVSLSLTGITDIDAQPVSLFRSPNGYLWVAWTASGAVRVVRSTDDGATWSAASSVVTQAGVAGPVALEMSGTTVVLVCTDNLGLGQFVRTIPQGAANVDPGSWTTEALPSLPSGVTSDDHLSLVGVPDGRVLMVTKTTGADTAAKPLFTSYVRATSGTWTMQTLEPGPDEVPPSYTRPRLTRLPSGEVLAFFGGIYGMNDLLVRSTAVDALGTWGGRSVKLLGPNWSDSAVVPFASDLAAAPAGAPWPLLAHNRDAKTIWVQWQSSASEGGEALPLYSGGQQVVAMYKGSVPIVALYKGSTKLY